MKTTKTISVSRDDKERHMLKMVFGGLLLFLGLVTTLLAGGQQYNGHFLNNTDANGVILDGYDPVAFFTDNKPVKGNPAFSYSYEEATYHFASQEHLDLFKANPEKYKPQFGGWCAYAVSLGRTAPIDVNTFSIIEGRLVIQHNQKAVNGWNKNPAGNLKLADKYWPKVSANGGKQIKTSEESNLPVWIIGGGIALLLAFLFFFIRRKTGMHSMMKQNPVMKPVTAPEM